MRREVLRAIEQGCWGVSTGLEYTREALPRARSCGRSSGLSRTIQALCDAYAERGRQGAGGNPGGVTIARNADARLQVSHLKAQNRVNWPKQAQALQLLDEAIASGLDVHADRYPYIAYNTGLIALFHFGRVTVERRSSSETPGPRDARAHQDRRAAKSGGTGLVDAVMISFRATGEE